MWTRRTPNNEPDAATAAFTSWLDVGNGHRVYFEDRGPRGAPVMLLLHGGPGSSATARQREWLDARRWRIVQFDQRGCGLSTPLGGIAHNDTQALVDDIERLRAHLGIDRWAVGAGSWGAALALVYVAAHRGCVDALVLRGSFLATRADLDWFYRDVAAIAPDAHARLMAALPSGTRADPVAYLHARFAADGDDALPLALTCQRYESDLDGSTQPPPRPSPHDAQRLVARYRVQMHYLVHDCFLDDGAVLRAAASLDGIPVAIVHGEHDLTCRPSNARDLQRACPDARLAWARGARHNPFHPAAAALLRDAGDCLLREGHFAAWPSPAIAAARAESGAGDPAP